MSVTEHLFLIFSITVSLLFTIAEKTSKRASPLGDRKTLIIFLPGRSASEYKILKKIILKLQQFLVFLFFLWGMGWGGGAERYSLLYGKLRHRWIELVNRRGERLTNKGFARYTVQQGNIPAAKQNQSPYNTQRAHGKPLGQRTCLAGKRKR